MQEKRKNIVLFIEFWIVKKHFNIRTPVATKSRVEISLPHILTEIKPRSAPQEQQARKFSAWCSPPSSWETVEKEPQLRHPFRSVSWIGYSQTKQKQQWSLWKKLSQKIFWRSYTYPYFSSLIYFPQGQSVWECRVLKRSGCLHSVFKSFKTYVPFVYISSGCCS